MGEELAPIRGTLRFTELSRKALLLGLTQEELIILDNINSGFWRRICHRLILDINHNEKNPHPLPSVVYEESKKLNATTS